jgi:HlyD family secretion protein
LKRSQIAIINSNYSGQRTLFKSDLTGSLDDLRKTYYQIKDEKLLRAPIAGVISKLPDVRTGMNVTRDQVIVRVIPGGTQAPQDYLYLAYTRAGEVKPGQKVYVKLDEFPYREYGAVEATVGEIDLLPSSSTYRVRLHLPHPLKTDYGLVLDDRPYYHGMAEVYTLRMNMFHKILREVRSKHKEIMRAS